jgi:regulatory protein
LTVALRMLAARRLTEAQLRERLQQREFAPEAIGEVVASCRRYGYLDDALFARLYVEARRQAVGDLRLIAELVRRGIPPDDARAAVASAACGQAERLDAAVEKVLRTRPGIALPAAARALERLGFPAHLVYRRLRELAQAGLGLSGQA